MKNLKKLSKLSVALFIGLSIFAPVFAQSGEDAVAGVFFFAMICTFIIVGLVFLGLNVYLTIDALNRDYKEDESMKIIGLLIIWIAPNIISIFSYLLYYILIMKKYPKAEKTAKKVEEGEVA